MSQERNQAQHEALATMAIIYLKAKAAILSNLTQAERAQELARILEQVNKKNKFEEEDYMSISSEMEIALKSYNKISELDEEIDLMQQDVSYLVSTERNSIAFGNFKLNGKSQYFSFSTTQNEFIFYKDQTSLSNFCKENLRKEYVINKIECESFFDVKAYNLEKTTEKKHDRLNRQNAELHQKIVGSQEKIELSRNKSNQNDMSTKALSNSAERTRLTSEIRDIQGKIKNRIGADKKTLDGLVAQMLTDEHLSTWKVRGLHGGENFTIMFNGIKHDYVVPKHAKLILDQLKEYHNLKVENSQSGKPEIDIEILHKFYQNIMKAASSKTSFWRHESTVDRYQKISEKLSQPLQNYLAQKASLASFQNELDKLPSTNQINYSP